jgi:2-hydroxy-3-oxopropionate reductase
MRVGFIGLGAMGRPMALNLLRAGHELAVWARRPESLAAPVEAGAFACASAREVGARAEVVFTMVTSSEDVRALALGPDGLIEAARTHAAHFRILVDSSTIAPAAAREIAAELGVAGIDMLDAPVSGGAQGAIAATLAIMVGGRAAALEHVRPLLEVLGKTIVHVGPSGAGQVAKACNQMVMVAAIEACAEAMLLARASGVDPAKVRLALQGGSAASRVLDLFGARMVERRFEAGVEARLHHKDFGLLTDEAVRLGVPLPVAGQVAQQLNALVGRGWGRADTASLLRVLEAQCRPAP